MTDAALLGRRLRDCGRTERQHPTIDPLELDWATLRQWIIELPDFVDDPAVTALYLLENIQREWYEEVAAQ